MTTHTHNRTLHHGNDAAEVVRSTIELAVAVHGLKRGLYRVAEMIGVSERWLTSLRFGQPARISADAYLRALEARQALAAERAAQLRAELATLEEIARDRPNEAEQKVGGACPDGGGRVYDVDRRGFSQLGGMACSPG